jgi:hypothetical protein
VVSFLHCALHAFVSSLCATCYMVIVLCNSSSFNHSCALLLLVVATKISSSKPSSPAAYKRKKSVSKLSSPIANGGGIARSNLSKHAVKSSVKSSSPAANGGQSAGDTTIVSVVSPNQSKSKSNVIYLKCVTINWLIQDATKKEVCKYVKFDVDFPLTQEDQLEMLMEKFTLADLKSAYFVTMGKVGIEDPSEIILPNNACKETVISSFISLIYDHRCMMYDYTENAFR